MTDEKRVVGGEIPRAPHDHELTGTGTPRSADTPPAQPAVPGGEEERDVIGGMTGTSQPAHADEVTINRSGSGGSGGPAVPDENVEGSSGQSLSELLTGEDEVQEQGG